jgi:hypothetical protein
MFTEVDFNNLITLVAQASALILGSGALGIAVTPVISYIKTTLGLNQPGKELEKRVVAVVTSIGVGCIAAMVVGHFIFTTLLTAVISSIIIIATSYKFYVNQWKDSDTIKKIEGEY